MYYLRRFHNLMLKIKTYTVRKYKNKINISYKKKERVSNEVLNESIMRETSKPKANQ